MDRQIRTAGSMSTTPSIKPPIWKIWFVAARPHTLAASVSPNIVAYNMGKAFIDFDEGANTSSSFFWLTLEWSIFCMLMQLGTNLHNDYADFVKGADNEKRVGQARATQKGWLTPFQTAMAATLTLLVGLFLGISFVVRVARSTDFSSNGSEKQLQRIATIVFVVVSSIFNAFAYTGGPWPLGYIGLPNFSLGYSGLGDLFVFLYFGLVATLMPPFIYIASNNVPSNVDDQLPQVLWIFLRYSIQVAVLATNIIVVNNLRDRHTDLLANKRTLAVRFGATFCKAEYAINLMVAYGLVIWNFYSNSYIMHPSKLLPFLSFPLAWKEWRGVCQEEGYALNKHVGGAARLQLFFCILLAASTRMGN